MVPMGILYAPKDVLGVDGAGAGATGFYKDGDKRYRVLSIVRDDVDQAKDVLKTFSKLRGATEEKGIGDGAYRLVVAGQGRQQARMGRRAAGQDRLSAWATKSSSCSPACRPPTTTRSA